MNIERKLAEWQEAGLLDAATVERILAHEGRGERRPYLLYAVGGLGALSIGIGLLSIVASNWDAIPASLKLVLDFALLLGLALSIARAPRRGWVAEVLIFVFYGAVLASVGLVAQVYHLGGRTEDALLFWSIITAPIVLHGTRRFLAAVWLVTTQSVVLAEILRALDDRSRRNEYVASATVAYLLALALVLVGGSAWIRARKPAFASVAATLGRVQLVGLATLMPLAWYTRWYEPPETGFALVCAAGVLAASVGLARREATATTMGGKPPKPPEIRRHLASSADSARQAPSKAPRGASPPASGAILAFAAAGPVVSYLPVIFLHESSGVPAALSFLLVWGILGFAAHRAGRIGLLNVATAFIGVRLIIVYFEVFGSLLDTGIGLLSGGVLTVLLAWLWVKKSREWKRRPGDGDRGGGGGQAHG